MLAYGGVLGPSCASQRQPQYRPVSSSVGSESTHPPAPSMCGALTYRAASPSMQVVAAKFAASVRRDPSNLELARLCALSLWPN